ncbi:hypothetical protein [Allobaculum sp. JKK-2023]|nr:hypothetical protein [Allobaculum sp. JKK-2023]
MAKVKEQKTNNQERQQTAGTKQSLNAHRKQKTEDDNKQQVPNKA